MSTLIFLNSFVTLSPNFPESSDGTNGGGNADPG